MAAYLTKSTLMNLNVNMTSPDTNGFAQAGQLATTGLELVDPIVNLIGAGSGPAQGGIWSGAGQPEATVVLQTNRIAAEVAKIEMEAANTAVGALEAALIDCRSNLRTFLAIADEHKIDIAEDGTATYREPDKVPEGAGDPDLERLTLTIKQLLKTATLADLDAKNALQRVTQNTPPVTDTANPALLDQAKASLDQALEDRQSIAETAALWEISRSPTWDDYANGGGGDKATNDVLDYVLKAWTTLGPGNHSLIGLLKDGPLATAAALGQTFFLKVFDPKKLAGRILGPVGIGQLALEGVLGIAGLYIETDDGKTAVDTHGGPEVRVYDADLAKTASQFYPGGTADDRDGAGSLADLAYYERVTSGPNDPTPWAAQARQTRADLQAWLDAHPDAADTEYVEGLITELDTALGE